MIRFLQIVLPGEARKGGPLASVVCSLSQLCRPEKVGLSTFCLSVPSVLTSWVFLCAVPLTKRAIQTIIGFQKRLGPWTVTLPTKTELHQPPYSWAKSICLWVGCGSPSLFCLVLKGNRSFEGNHHEFMCIFRLTPLPPPPS